MYRLFYNHKITGDILYILNDPAASVDRVEKRGDVVALYGGSRLVGVNIFEVSKVFKLRTGGMIAAPEDALIDVVNSILEGAMLPKLPYCRDSGFKVGKIVSLEEHPLDEKASLVEASFGVERLSCISWYRNLAVGALIVAALDGTIAFDGTVFHKTLCRGISNDCSLLSAKQLHLEGPDEGAFIVSGYQPGEDFFLGGH
jgi:hypothetical protein